MAVGTVIHELIWFVDAPDGQISSFFKDRCLCVDKLSFGVPMCFCGGTILAIILCVWVAPFILMVMWVDDVLMQKSHPIRRFPSSVC